MRHLSTSILRQVYRAIATPLIQWRDLHSQSWGWGHDEQPRIVDEPVYAAPKTDSSPSLSRT